jgi:hypothetical protein
MNIKAQDNFLPERLANFCASHITRNYDLKEFRSRNLHDSTKNKNNRFFNRLAARILEDLGHEDPLPEHGCIVNSFSTGGIPLGPHDYSEHNGRGITDHSIYFLSEGGNFSGGSVFYSSDSILPLQLRQESKYCKCEPKHNRLINAPSKLDRFSNIILESDAPIIQVNVFCFSE